MKSHLQRRISKNKLGLLGRKHLDAIAPVQRVVLVLRYLEGMSPPEIAMATGKSVHAIESLLVRGRAAFKRTYLEQGHE